MCLEITYSAIAKYPEKLAKMKNPVFQEIGIPGIDVQLLEHFQNL